MSWWMFLLKKLKSSKTIYIKRPGKITNSSSLTSRRREMKMKFFTKIWRKLCSRLNLRRARSPFSKQRSRSWSSMWEYWLTRLTPILLLFKIWGLRATQASILKDFSLEKDSGRPTKLVRMSWWLKEPWANLRWALGLWILIKTSVQARPWTTLCKMLQACSQILLFQLSHSKPLCHRTTIEKRLRRASWLWRTQEITI